MTNAERDEPATTDVLDLYDVLPQAVVQPEEAEDDFVTAMIKGGGRNFAALVGLFAVSLARVHRLQHAVQRGRGHGWWCSAAPPG